MDRLTYRTGAGTPNLNYPAHITEDQVAKSAFRQMAIERLAAYEDTGLSPEICAEYKKFEDECVKNNITFKKVLEWIEAEKDGRLVVLPCRVGDVLWTYCTWPENYIYSAEVVAVEVSDGAVSIKADRISNVMPAGDIGKTVFLTRAEAEAALKGGEENA